MELLSYSHRGIGWRLGLILCGCFLASGARADVIYTLTQNLPGTHPGDAPAFIWTATTASYIPDGSDLPFSTASVVGNADAISDGYLPDDAGLLQPRPDLGGWYYAGGGYLNPPDPAVVGPPLPGGYPLTLYDTLADISPPLVCPAVDTVGCTFSQALLYLSIGDGSTHSAWAADTLTVTAAPEPASLILLTTGIGVLFLLLRRKRVGQ